LLFAGARASDEWLSWPAGTGRVKRRFSINVCRAVAWGLTSVCLGILLQIVASFI
jgi:hypothetical protein